MWKGGGKLWKETKKASETGTNDRNNQADQTSVLASVEVHACTGVGQTYRPGSPNVFLVHGGVRVCEVAARVCRLMDSGARTRDWLQCTSIGLCVPRRITTRNIISTDWHFAFASINIARDARGISNSRERDIRTGSCPL